jgi:hypothetical protein
LWNRLGFLRLPKSHHLNRGSDFCRPTSRLCTMVSPLKKANSLYCVKMEAISMAISFSPTSSRKASERHVDPVVTYPTAASAASFPKKRWLGAGAPHRRRRVHHLLVRHGPRRCCCAWRHRAPKAARAPSCLVGAPPAPSLSSCSASHYQLHYYRRLRARRWQTTPRLLLLLLLLLPCRLSHRPPHRPSHRPPHRPPRRHLASVKA